MLFRSTTEIYTTLDTLSLHDALPILGEPESHDDDTGDDETTSDNVHICIDCLMVAYLSSTLTKGHEQHAIVIRPRSATPIAVARE